MEGRSGRIGTSPRKEELYRAVVQERGRDALPGVRTWLERCGMPSPMRDRIVDPTANIVPR